MRSLRLINKWIIAAILAGSAMAVQAVPITGSIQMGGLVNTVDPFGNSTTLGSATGLAFVPLIPNTNKNMMVYLATGDFTQMGPTPLFGNIQNFQFNPFVGNVTNFWTAGGFSFALNSLAINTQNNNFLNISGTGTITAPANSGLSATTGYWSLSAQSGGSTGSIFSWSSSSGVPEPGPLALLGIGLFAIGAMRVRSSVKG
ncbi:MAG: PEP-CTERM sorting domain-containing protein [Gammaproteobacteria bacterium]